VREICTSEAFLNAGWGWTGAWIAVALCPAVFEEVAFRGIIQQRLLAFMSPWNAIIVAASMFAILHLNIIGFAMYLIPMALMAGWITWRTSSLWPAIAIHFVHNGTVLVLEAIK
jgi:uncharacterized protein